MITTRKTQERVDAMCLTEGCQCFHVGVGTDAWAIDHIHANPQHLVSVTRLTVDLHYTREGDDES